MHQSKMHLRLRPEKRIASVGVGDGGTAVLGIPVRAETAIVDSETKSSAGVPYGTYPGAGDAAAEDIGNSPLHGDEVRAKRQFRFRLGAVELDALSRGLDERAPGAASIQPGDSAETSYSPNGRSAHSNRPCKSVVACLMQRLAAQRDDALGTGRGASCKAALRTPAVLPHTPLVHRHPRPVTNARDRLSSSPA